MEHFIYIEFKILEVFTTIGLPVIAPIVIAGIVAEWRNQGGEK